MCLVLFPFLDIPFIGRFKYSVTVLRVSNSLVNMPATLRTQFIRHSRAYIYTVLLITFCALVIVPILSFAPVYDMYDAFFSSYALLLILYHFGEATASPHPAYLANYLLHLVGLRSRNLCQWFAYAACLKHVRTLHGYDVTRDGIWETLIHNVLWYELESDVWSFWHATQRYTCHTCLLFRTFPAWDCLD